jgi:cell fate regulator YaaT (PSP1 superfamily)
MKNSIQLVNVRFFDQVQPATLVIGHLDVKYGQKVVALSNRGKAIGVVNSFPFSLSDNAENKNYQSIIKIATEQDIDECKKIYQEQRKAGEVFKDLVAQHGLKMNLERFEYTSFGQKITFYFRSPTRVDFRDLLRSLRKKFPQQIELHQRTNGEVSSRVDKIGPCGMELCLFINSTLKDPNVINKCNEFKCCLDLKDPFYEDRLSRLPQVGDYICTHADEVGRVEKLDVVREEFELLTDQGVIKRYVSHMYKQKLSKKAISFPADFENISRDTGPVIGRKDYESRQNDLLSLENEEVIKRNKQFVEKKFELLFGATGIKEAELQADELE